MEPPGERLVGAVEYGSSGGGGLESACAALPETPPTQEIRRRTAASGAAESVRPPRPSQVGQARILGREGAIELGQRPRETGPGHAKTLGAGVSGGNRISTITFHAYPVDYTYPHGQYGLLAAWRGARCPPPSSPPTSRTSCGASEPRRTASTTSSPCAGPRGFSARAAGVRRRSLGEIVWPSSASAARPTPRPPRGRSPTTVASSLSTCRRTSTSSFSGSIAEGISRRRSSGCWG